MLELGNFMPYTTVAETGPNGNRRQPEPIGVNTAADEMRARITRVAKYADGHRSTVRYPSLHLFTLTSLPLGTMNGPGHDHPGFTLPREILQNAGLEVMREFGFDEGSVVEDRISPNTTRGTETRYTEYTSSTPGLIFERTVEIDKKSGRFISVEWFASEKLPAIKVQGDSRTLRRLQRLRGKRRD